MEIKRKTLPAQTYLYVERAPKFSPEEISNAMATGFGEVYTFLGQNNIAPASMPMSLYADMPTGDTMPFRAGFLIHSEDASKAIGNIKVGVIPVCDVMMATHIGSYANLNQTHKDIWDATEKEGLTKTMPVWEIYVDDPTTVAPETCRTEVYHAVK